MIAPIDARRWLRVPFRLGGRDPAIGLDCWGLYRAIVAEAAGVVLDEHGGLGAYPAIARRLTDEAAAAGWRRIEPGAERPLDLVLMTGLVRGGDGRTRSAPLHVGCVVMPGLMIDTEETTGVMVRAFRDTALRRALPTVTPRLLGLHRPAALEGLA
ncbi:NlpC/P60 family protein [Pinisolibacter sp.]|uniref:NlpC/P60 family protein n=1 Tax=Pinisolibacter sp. TaxID=2172024 RepID=UPI002FDCCE1B